MFAALALTLVVSQTNVITMAAPSFSLVGIEPALGAAWQDRFVSRLGGDGLKVTSSSDIQQMLGLERQRALLGCNAETSCLAELAGALGVELLLSGNIVKSESGYLATVRVLSTKTGQPIAAATERLRNESALLDWLDATAVDLRRQLLGPPPTGLFVRLVPGLIGGALLVAGGVLLGVSGANYARLTGSEVLPVGDIAPLRQQGELFGGLGLSFAIAGGVGVLTSVLWAALSPGEQKKSVQVAIGPLGAHGAFLGVSGVLP